MAKLVLTNGYFEIESQDESDHVKSVTLTVNKDLPDATTITDAWAACLSGLKSGEIAVEFYQDYADDDLDEDLWTHFDATTSATIKVRPDAGAAAAANPEYEFEAHLPGYNPIAGAAGDVVGTTINFKITGAVARNVS